MTPGSEQAADAKPASPTFTRRQRNALPGCYWRPCPTCGENVPVLRSDGSVCLGFREWHRPTCKAT